MATEVSQLTKLFSLLLANWSRVLLTLLAVSLVYLLIRFIRLLRWRQAFRYALRDFPKHPNGSWLLGDVPEVGVILLHVSWTVRCVGVEGNVIKWINTDRFLHRCCKTAFIGKLCMQYDGQRIRQVIFGSSLFWLRAKQINPMFSTGAVRSI